MGDVFRQGLHDLAKWVVRIILSGLLTFAILVARMGYIFMYGYRDE